MKSYFIAAIIAVSVALQAGVCFGQYTKDEDLRTGEGRVTAVDTGKPSVTVDIGIDVTFPISSDTEFRYGNNDIGLSDIDIGDYVKVEYYRSGLESRVPAKVIRVTLMYKKSEEPGFSEADADKQRRF